MKKTKIIVPAMGLLLLGTAGSITGTVAWFSMNASVSVTGMNVRTTVGSNILISEDAVESHFSSGLNQPVSGILEPVSTVNGVDFFYHSTSKEVAGDGHVTDEEFIAYVEGNDFDANYGFSGAGTECYGYKDYSFYIKATNGESSQRTLAMSKCNLTYQGIAVQDKAWRVALFAVETTKSAGVITEVDDEDAAVVGNLKSILRLNSAAYFNDEAVEAVDSFGSVNAKLDAAAEIENLSRAATGYFKVIVRLWLEGNDTTCNNETYANLTADYQLDLSFAMVDHNATPTPEAGVNLISSTQNAAATASNNVGTVTLSSGSTGTITNLETAASFQWYNATTGASIGGATAYQYTNTDTENGIDVYCVVTTARGNTYRTNTISLTKKTA